MKSPQQGKFSPLMLHVKRGVRRLRLESQHSVDEGARLLGISRKHMEDVETERNYGCHLDLELLAKIRAVYGASIDELLGDLPKDVDSELYRRRSRDQPDFAAT